MSRYALLLTFLVAVAIIAWDEIKVAQRFPMPKRFVYAAVVWGILGVIAELGADDVAAAFGVGMVLVLAYQHYKAPAAVPPDQTGRTRSEYPATQ